MITVTCCVCCVAFGLTEQMATARRADGITFYCPVGHGQSYKKDPPPLNAEIAELTIQLKNAKMRESEARVEAARQERLRKRALKRLAHCRATNRKPRI